MNKLEDKLAASIKPSQGRVPGETSAATAEPRAKPQRTRTRVPAPLPTAAVPDLNDVNRPLHPDRIWPD